MPRAASNPTHITHSTTFNAATPERDTPTPLDYADRLVIWACTVACILLPVLLVLEPAGGTV